MLDPKSLDEFARRLSAAVPAGMRELGSDFEKNLRAAAEGALNRLNLVTREEFEAQQAVLARAREKLAELEARIVAIEDNDRA